MTLDVIRSTLATAVPTHDAGDQQTAAGRWVSERDAIAWHEAAHAVVARALGRQVTELSVDSARAEAHGWRGLCRIASYDDLDEETRLRVKALIAMAGPNAVNIVREGLGVAADFTGTESLSALDAHDVDAANAVLPEGGPDFEELCRRQAVTIVLTRREAFAALVAALLEQETLDEEAIAACLDGLPL